MPYPTQYPVWLAVAARDERGGLAAELPSIVRGRTRVFTLNLPTSAEYDDWTDGALAANLRASPDAGGSALATYTIVAGTPSGGSTPFTFTLLDEDQGSLPAGGEDGVAELLCEITFTPTGGDADTIISTRQLVTGAI